jgi:hypothetical protein
MVSSTPLKVSILAPTKWVVKYDSPVFGIAKKKIIIRPKEFSNIFLKYSQIERHL